MAKKIITTNYCDLCVLDDVETVATGSTLMRIGSLQRAIDLCERHRDDLARFEQALRSSHRARKRANSVA